MENVFLASLENVCDLNFFIFNGKIKIVLFNVSAILLRINLKYIIAIILSLLFLKINMSINFVLIIQISEYHHAAINIISFRILCLL